MEKYVPPEKRTIQMILEEIDEGFARWQDVYEHGCADPYWEDGFNLNLVRGHIVNAYRLLHQKIEEQEQMSIYSVENDIGILRPVPPLMDDKWMCPTGRYPNRLIDRKGK